jgi:hypothetical protein
MSFIVSTHFNNALVLGCRANIGGALHGIATVVSYFVRWIY